MTVWCEVCGKREAWAKNLKHPICAECAVLAWQKLSEDAEIRPTKRALDAASAAHAEADSSPDIIPAGEVDTQPRQ